MSADADAVAMAARPIARSGNAALRVAIAGFGSIGRLVGRRLDAGLPGLALVSVSARDPDRARDHLNSYSRRVDVLPLTELATEADVVVDCAPPLLFLDVMRPALRRGRTVVTVSATALLDHADVIEEARRNGGRIILATGSVLGLDALRSASVGTVHSVLMTTRKPPESLAQSTWVKDHNIDTRAITSPTRIFEGTAREAARAFPDKFNLAATVALASIGPDHVRIEIWLDPTVERNVHRIKVDADSTRFEMEIQNIPNPGHEGTGPYTANTVIAALQDLVSPFRVGS
jgi:aspartate dehydrogenase